MTAKQKLLHQSLIKQVHISKRYQEYYKHDKDEYVELLKEHFDTSTSKELSIDELIILVDYMNFKRDQLPKHDGKLCSAAQIRTMRELWCNFASNPNDEALLKFINTKFSKEYTDIKTVGIKVAQKTIPVLQVMKRNKL